MFISEVIRVSFASSLSYGQFTNNFWYKFEMAFLERRQRVVNDKVTQTLDR